MMSNNNSNNNNGAGDGYKFFVRLGDNASSPTCTIRRSIDELSNDDNRFMSLCAEVLDKYLKYHPDEDGEDSYDVELKYYFCLSVHTAPNWWNHIDNQQDFDDALDYGRIHQNNQRLLQLIAVVKKDDRDSIEKKSPSALSSSSPSSVQQQRNSTSRDKAAKVVASSLVPAINQPKQPPPAPKSNPGRESNREPQPNRPPPPPPPAAAAAAAATTATASAAASATRQPPRVVRGHNASPSQPKDVAVSNARSQLQRSAIPEPKKNDNIAPHHTIAPKKSPLPPTAPPAAEQPKNAASLVAVAAAKDRSSLKIPPTAQEGSNKRQASTTGIEESTSKEKPVANKKAKVSVPAAEAIDANNKTTLEDEIMLAMTEMNALGITKPPYEKVACCAGGLFYFMNRQGIDAAFSELSKKNYIEVSKDDGGVVVGLTRVGMNRDEYKVEAPQTRDEVHQRIRELLQVLTKYDESEPSSSQAPVPLFNMLRNGESHSRDDITTELGEDGIPSNSLPPALSLLNALGIVDYVGFEAVMMMPKFAFPVFEESAEGDGGSGSSSSVAAPAVVSDCSTSNEEGGCGVGPVDNGSDTPRVADDETLDYDMPINFATV